MAFAKAKAWHSHDPLDEKGRSAFRAEQELAVLRAFEIYNPEAMVIYGPDFGHTDPQYVLPFGGLMMIDGPAQQISGTAGWEQFPAFLKQPIGTASGGVRRVDSSQDITSVEHAAPDLVVQALVEGPLAMCQAVFNRGSMVAFHANLRTGEGANGGASRKCSVNLPDAQSWMEVLGSGLQWHGALSADVIVSTVGAKFIDINPRLVEPINAWFDGVDLVGAMLDLAQGAAPRAQNPAGGDVRTHQLLLAVLGAAQHGKGRSGVWAELRDGISHRGEYKESREELAQLRGDPLSAIPLVMASVATMIRPDAYRWFTSGSVSNYALTADAWRLICNLAARK